MFFKKFSNILPALGALLSRGAQPSGQSPVVSVEISNSGGANLASFMPPRSPAGVPDSQYRPVRNQRKERKNRRRAHAAGFRVF